jgi:hypothetical protein
VIEERQLSLGDTEKPQVISETVLIARIVMEERVREEMNPGSRLTESSKGSIMRCGLT